MKKNRLFQVLSWETKKDNDDNDYLVVEISKNKHIEDTTIIIPLDKFEKYLDIHDILYREKADCFFGEHTVQCYKISIEDYLAHTDFDYIEEDIYDYICVKHVDINRAFQITHDAMQSILQHFKP